MSHHGRKRVLPTGGVVRSVTVCKRGLLFVRTWWCRRGSEQGVTRNVCRAGAKESVGSSGMDQSHQENQSAITGHGSSPAASMIASDSSDGTVPELSQESVSIFVSIASPYWYSPQ
ncbi:hypothetical protein VFPFJ_11418 [Purpureocillium lilacinum]|uniref:Uncharacterized protein n=1 Tax=Purpureocillium lilacinum TaxID=33203 RepID=A0A179FB58_PURLI|nr:hypothetical protein VFPFJ_11418 [Purpureocillium lilacinum]OAQ62521.1 hypothetical protein VFPFJ_11418 [Purpureocillium lilacinum]